MHRSFSVGMPGRGHPAVGLGFREGTSGWIPLGGSSTRRSPIDPARGRRRPPGYGARISAPKQSGAMMRSRMRFRWRDCSMGEETATTSGGADTARRVPRLAKARRRGPLGHLVWSIIPVAEISGVAVMFTVNCNIYRHRLCPGIPSSTSECVMSLRKLHDTALFQKDQKNAVMDRMDCTTIQDYGM